MASARQRNAPRVDVTLDVTLQTVDGDVPCKTRDASYQGVFIVRRDPLPLRKLIRFRAELPDTGEELQMLGLVAHTVNAAEAAEDDRSPGMGIQLFSLGQQTRRQWRQFIDQLYEQDPRARQTIASSRRPAIQMRIPDEVTLNRLRTVDLPKRRLFVRTPDVHPEGTDVDCVIHHPEGDTFTIEATVTDQVNGSVKDRGVELNLHLPEDRVRLTAFLDGEIPDEPQPQRQNHPSPPLPDDIDDTTDAGDDESPPTPDQETSQ